MDFDDMFGGAGLFSPNGDFAHFMESLRDGSFATTGGATPSAPSTTSTAPQTALTAITNSGITAAPPLTLDQATLIAAFQAGLVSSDTLSKLSQGDWFANATRPAYFYGDSFSCAGCDFLASLPAA